MGTSFLGFVFLACLLLILYAKELRHLFRLLLSLQVKLNFIQFTLSQLFVLSLVFALAWVLAVIASYELLEMAFAAPGFVLICIVLYLGYQKKWLIASVICVAYFAVWGSTVMLGKPTVERQLAIWLDENYKTKMDIYEINSPCPFVIKASYYGGGGAFALHGTVYYLQALDYTCEFYRGE